MANRRSFLQSALGLGAGLFANKTIAASPHHKAGGAAWNTPVITTDIGDLPYRMDGGVKVFELTAHVMEQEIAPSKTIDVWGFNGSAPGPTIQVTEGDRVRVIFRNHLPEPSSMHWHGFEDRVAYDGMPGISQEPVKPGGQFIYEFDIRQRGTFFYHSHMAMQEMAGMLGAFIMHPKQPYQPHCDKDYVVHLQEYAVLPNNTVPNTANMEFNWLLLNGKAGPATTPLLARLGDRVRIRFVNLGMDHHPMHLHGHTFHVTGTEGGRIPEAGWWPGNTVLVGVAQARDVEFVANNPGDWMLHCHLPHHMMNQMSSQAGLGRSDNTATTDGPLSDAQHQAAMEGIAKTLESGVPEQGALQRRQMEALHTYEHGMQMGQGMQMGHGDIAANANDVPNFPQDAYMEGPMMQMDDKVERPENYGLRPGWSQYMQGMMTFIRVLPPETYDEVVARMRDAKRVRDPYASFYASRAIGGGL